MYDSIIDALRRGAAGDALAAAEALVADRPDDAQAHRWLSAAQQQVGQAEAALASIDRAIALAPENAELHLARAGVLIGSRRPDEAQAALSSASGLDPNQFGAYLIQAQLALGRGDLDEAERYNRLAARVSPDHPQLAAVDGMVTLRRGDADRALKIVSAAMQAAPDDAQLRYALGFIHMALGHWAFAEQAFRGIVDKTPGTHSLRSLIADLVRRQGRPADAADELQVMVAQTGTDNPALHRHIGQLRLAAGQNDEALKALRVALAAQPRERATLLAIIEAWRRLGAQDDARASLDAALATTPDSHELWLSRLVFEAVGSAEARAVVERWVAAMPTHLPALEAQMTVLDAAGEADGAEAVALRIVELDPGRTSGEQRVVEALLARDPDAAIARVTGIIAGVQDVAQQQSLRGWLGFVQDRAGRHADAVATWSALAHELAPSRLPLWTPTAPPAEWPARAQQPDGPAARPMLLWGAPGTVVESLAGVIGYITDEFRGDRFLPQPPKDGFQNYTTPAALASGALSGQALIAEWQATLPARGIHDGKVVDWLLWWDNALLHALRPHLPQGLLLIAVRDPRDAFLDWMAFGSPAPLALDDLQEGAQWMATLFGQIADLHEQDLYEHRLIRMDAIKDDAGGVSAALGEALGAQLPVPPSSGARRFPEGHWRHYAAALSGPFAALTPVAVRLGYPEA
ncbi:tetratricopeptide repeat protein [Pseudoxanthomonas sp. SL93]|uniref:tetratricopeptide repeat protein n=1 Tax=Pseudoxanthomonas sp. SL93 TaxID=2995142 RepID=UPI0022715CAC|nr:tetratricopeptide repeat protein [Pseudoxanthomonas sp. SL93]WAC62542.1 tetratricopeptide repeat protein [Pseudoxanthomonas sp. SL93]